MAEELEVTKQSINTFFEDTRPKSKSDTSPTTNPDSPDYTEIVSDIYQEILNRPPDIGGLKNYSNKLKYNIITEKELRNILMNSDEYRLNESLTKKLDNLGMNPDSSEYILNESLTKPDNLCTDLSKLDLDLKQSINPGQSSSSSSSSSSSFSLVYCMIGGNRIQEIKPYLETILPHIDTLVYIDSFSTDGSSDYIKQLSNQNPNKIVLIQKDWNDKFSEFRNHYLEYLKLSNCNNLWTIVSDTDEHYPAESLIQIRYIIPELEKHGYTGLRVQVEDILVDDNDINKILSRNVNTYWKPLIFKYHPNLHYEGEPHELLTGNDIAWYQSNIIYHHIRSKLHIYVNATRNFFISNSNRWSDKWTDFRFLCTKNKILKFEDFYQLFEEHKLPGEIEEWINVHKDDNEDAGDSEVREMALLYNVILPDRRHHHQTKSKAVDSIKSIKEITDSKTEITDSKTSSPSPEYTISMNTGTSYTAEDQLRDIIKKYPDIANNPPPTLASITFPPVASITLPSVEAALIDKISKTSLTSLSEESIINISLNLVKVAHKKHVEIGNLLKFIEISYKLFE